MEDIVAEEVFGETVRDTAAIIVPTESGQEDAFTDICTDFTAGITCNT